MNSRIEQNIIHFISEQNLLQIGDRVVIALSGGPDSVFALHFFHKYSTLFKIEVSAFHVNHMLRGKFSDEDELFCNAICKNLNVPFESVSVNVKEYAKSNKYSIEEAARNLRYQKLNEYLVKTDAGKIITAHNLEDNTETVLLNLFRGTGLKGAAGIPIKRDNIIRPLLSTSKKDILNYLELNGIEYRTDLTNFENDFSRNFLRNEIIPKIKEKINPGVDRNIFRFSEIVSSAEKSISEYASEVKNKFIKKNESGIIISNLILDNKFINIFSDAVKQALEENFQKSFTFDDISKLKSLFGLQVGNKVELSNNIIASKEREFVSLFYKSEVECNEVLLNNNECVQISDKTVCASIIKKDDVHFSKSDNIEFIDGDKIEFPLLLRRWKDGDKFNPLGLKGSKKISDFLTEIKVNSFQKKEQLVLLNKGKIIWVVGYRIDENVKINNKTKRIIKLWIK